MDNAPSDFEAVCVNDYGSKTTAVVSRRRTRLIGHRKGKMLNSTIKEALLTRGTDWQITRQEITIQSQKEAFEAP